MLNALPAALPPQTPTVSIAVVSTTIPHIPFFSQFRDITPPRWQGVGCGVTSLAMVIDFYKPNAVSVNDLLQQGIAEGAYEAGAGWTYDGLIQLSKEYGLTGGYYDLSKFSVKTALAKFRKILKSGPVILSVHNKFNPRSAVPHLVVINGMKNNIVYYNDPAAKMGNKKISIMNFLKGWKEKLIVIRPQKDDVGLAASSTFSG